MSEQQRAAGAAPPKARVFAAKVLRRVSRQLDRTQAKLLEKEPLAARAQRLDESALADRALRNDLRKRADKQHEAVERQRRQLAKVLKSYTDVREALEGIRTFDPENPLHVPRWSELHAVERTARVHAAEHEFFSSLLLLDDLDVALAKSIRRMLSVRGLERARSIAHVLQRHPELARVGDVTLAMVAVTDHVPATAWELFSRHDPALCVRLAASEYFRAGFAVAPAEASVALANTLRSDAPATVPARAWLEIAQASFAAGHEDLSRQALDLAEEAVDPALAADIDWLRRWYGRAAEAAEAAAAPAGVIPFAVVSYDHVDRGFASTNLGDTVQTLASLGHLVRRTGIRFSGDKELVGIAEGLRARVAPGRVVEGDVAEFALFRVDRDASSYSAVPEGTWMIAFGWYMHRMFRMRYDFPFNPRLRPILLSVHINVPRMLTREVVDYLRRYAPVGCRDWNTVFLLQAAGVPAFFSGCITTTTDTLFPPDPAARPEGTLYVDAPPKGEGAETFEQCFDAVRERGLAANVDDAIARVESYHSTYAKVVTSRLHCYLPARSIGADVEFVPRNPADPRFDGLAFLDDVAYDKIRAGILTKLDAVLGAIAGGSSEDEVYALWREICAPDVAAAHARAAAIAPIAEVSFDLRSACDTVHAESVILERTEPAPDGEEMNIEFSLDGNFKHQLDVVLQSVVARATRPIRAFVLCREHQVADFHRVAALFPSVSFVWLPTDHVDYGPIIGMIRHITVATMDRLLMPDLLPEVSRIVHLDLDGLCLGDVAELWDVNLGDKPVAARSSPQPQFRSGFSGILSACIRLKQTPERARELVARTHTRHTFDFLGFNAGVMVLNLERMRADDFCRQFLPYVERFGMNDQEVMNAYAGNDRVEIDADWNRFPRLEIVAEAKFVHWAGAVKPWHAPYVQCQELWHVTEDELRARKAAVGAGG